MNRRGVSILRFQAEANFKANDTDHCYIQWKWKGVPTPLFAWRCPFICFSGRSDPDFSTDADPGRPASWFICRHLLWPPVTSDFPGTVFRGYHSGLPAYGISGPVWSLVSGMGNHLRSDQQSGHSDPPANLYRQHDRGNCIHICDVCLFAGSHDASGTAACFVESGQSDTVFFL